MKSTISLFIIVLLCAIHAPAQNFHMVKDVNDSKDSNPYNYFSLSEGGSSFSFAVLNNVAYFSATDGINGYQLWRSDGTNTGTYMLKVVPATISKKNFTGIIASGKYVYFDGNDSIHGSELWRTDGTKDGTIMVKDIYSGPGNSVASNLTDVNGELFFSADDGIHGRELWKSDGTEAGTNIVKDINLLTQSSGIESIANVNGKAFFNYDTPGTSLTGLWVSDGTSAGTIQLTSNAFYYYSDPNSYHAVGDKYFFRDATGNPAVSDGTVNGTYQIKQISSGVVSGFAELNGIAYFTAYDPINGSSLWRTDGTSNNTYIITSIKENADGIPQQLTASGNNLFFLQDNNLGNTDLWKTDGTVSGTALVKSFGNEPLAPLQQLKDINGTLYFEGYTANEGYEMWKSDGTTSGTVLIKDIYSGKPGSNASGFTSLSGAIIFAANDGVFGNELWISNGTTGNAYFVKDINNLTSSGTNPDNSLTPFKNKIFFKGYSTKYGNEIWSTNGTAETTNIVTDVQPGSANGVSAVTGPFFTSTNKLYFQANTFEYGNELWSTDGAQTTLVRDITQGYLNTYFPSTFSTVDNKKEFCNIDSTVFFVSGQYGDTLWKTTGSGATAITDGRNISGLTVNKSDVYFVSNESIWKTNGTTAGTIKLNNTSVESAPNYIPSLISFQDKIFFQSFDNEMWITDGTDAGTFLFKKINPQFDDAANYASATNVQLNNTLFFVADDGSTGKELWKTDGTKKGTVLLKDINAGSGSSFSDDYLTGYFTLLNNKFFFTADDNIHGSELWVSDGTTNGTVMVKDITPGSAPSLISSLTKVGNKLAFLVYNNSSLKEELWETDGSEAGTNMVNDPNLTDVTIYDYYNNAMSCINDQLYFTGYTSLYGSELWTGTLENVLATTLFNFSGNLIDNKDAELSWQTVNEQNLSYFNLQRSLDGIHYLNIAKILSKGIYTGKTNYQFIDKDIKMLGVKNVYYRLEQIDVDNKSTMSNVVNIKLNDNKTSISVQPNPVQSKLEIHVNDNQTSHSIKIQITNINGVKMLSDTKQIGEDNVVTYNTSSWPAGIYIATIIFDDGTKKEIKIAKAK